MRRQTVSSDGYKYENTRENQKRYVRSPFVPILYYFRKIFVLRERKFEYCTQ